jgi:hypothetical protein
VGFRMIAVLAALLLGGTPGDPHVASRPGPSLR